MSDPVLEVIIKLAETGPEIDIPVTLAVGGLLISGRVISREDYMQENWLTASIEEGIKQALSQIGFQIALVIRHKRLKRPGLNSVIVVFGLFLDLSLVHGRLVFIPQPLTQKIPDKQIGCTVKNLVFGKPDGIQTDHIHETTKAGIR